MLIEPLKRHAPSKRVFTIVSLIVGALLFLVIMYNETPMHQGKSTFYIPASTTAAVIKSLEENGYELNFIDRLILRIVHQPQKGWYRILGEEPGRLFFLKNLYKKRVRPFRVRVFAGETKKEIFHRLSRDLMLDEKKLDGNYTKLARFEEGNILAGRYLLPRSPEEENIIKYLLKKSNARLDSFAQLHFGSDFNTSQMRRILIIASIIQRESNDVREMADISSVIHNRLKKRMRLQMDGTLNYGKYSRTIVTSERIKSDRSKYNTYRHKGLIPAPLGSVTIDAIKAAAFPNSNGYLFFVLGEDGRHIFASTYKEHLNNVRAFKQWLRVREAEKKRKERQELEKRRQKLRQSNTAARIDHNQSHPKEKSKVASPHAEHNQSNRDDKEKRHPPQKKSSKTKHKKHQEGVSRPKVPKEKTVRKQAKAAKKPEENRTVTAPKDPEGSSQEKKETPEETNRAESPEARKKSVDPRQIQELFSDINISKK